MYVKWVRAEDSRLGRVVVHDPRSRAFPMAVTVDTSTWRTRTLRTYDPIPNPNQEIGCCTYCSKSTQLNTVGNRVKGVILNMSDALTGYSLATKLDPFTGFWPPDDTGSSGLAAAKAAQQLGQGGEYRWFFGGVDPIVSYLMTPDAVPVSVGTYWYYDMFDQDSRGRIEPTGQVAGGHQWTIRGYDVTHDEFIARCWWGYFRDFRIRREHVGDLLADDGDAHVQLRLGANG